MGESVNAVFDARDDYYLRLLRIWKTNHR